MFRSLPIHQLITIGFGLIVFVFALSGTFSLNEVTRLQKMSEQISDTRVPTVYTSTSMKNFVNQALSSLRGWLLLKEDHFDNNLRETWIKIRAAEVEMLQLSEHWTHNENTIHFKELQALLNKLEKTQFEIYDVSNRDSNLPANQLLTEEVVPLLLSMTDRIMQLVDLEESLEINQERKELLISLIKFRNTLGKALVHIRSYIITGHTYFIEDFEISWAENQQHFEHLVSEQKLFSPHQLSVFSILSENREQLISLSNRTLEIRKSDDWNRANYLLRDQAIPLSQQIMGLLGQIIEHQNNELSVDNNLLEQSINQFKLEILLLCLAAVLFAIWLGLIISHRSSEAQILIDNRATLIDQNIMIAHLDTEGHIKDISNSLCRALEGIKSDFIDKQSFFFLPGQEKDPLYSTITKTIQTDQSWEGEISRTNQNNETIWFHSILIPILENNINNRGFTNILQNITDKKRLEELSITDKLTTLFNRRHFDNILEQQLKLAQRMETSITLCIIDIDFFKEYNDFYGHQAGDHALTQVAHLLKHTLKRPNDFVFRLGGEEFGIIFNNMDAKQVNKIIRKIQLGVIALAIKHKRSKAHDFLTISIGCKVCTTARDMQIDSLYLAADTALYEAKKTRNSIVIV